MTSVGNRKAMADRQIQAVIFNMKEERVLDRSKHTLDLEREHALKLIQLSRKDVKVAQKRLKTKVSRIKSYLTPEEIMELRMQEVQGKLPAEPRPVTSSAIQISSARRRLKLQPTDHVTSHTGSTQKPRSAAAAASSGKSHQVTSSSACKHHASKHARDTALGKGKSRPMTSAGVPIQSLNPRPPMAPRPHTAHAVNYSSHDQHEKTDGDSRRYSVDSDASLGSNLAKQKAAERRHDLLETEYIRTAEIEKRRTLFMTEALKWAKDNPAIHKEPVDVFATIKRISSAAGKRCGSASRARTGRRRSQHHLYRTAEVQDGTVSEQEECVHKILDAWKDMKKCRYLRLASEEGDLSGVKTLVRDQFMMLKTLQPGFRRPGLMRRESGATVSGGARLLRMDSTRTLIKQPAIHVTLVTPEVEEPVNPSSEK